MGAKPSTVRAYFVVSQNNKLDTMLFATSNVPAFRDAGSRQFIENLLSHENIEYDIVAESTFGAVTGVVFLLRANDTQRTDDNWKRLLYNARSQQLQLQLRFACDPMAITPMRLNDDGLISPIDAFAYTHLVETVRCDRAQLANTDALTMDRSYRESRAKKRQSQREAALGLVALGTGAAGYAAGSRKKRKHRR